MSDIVLFAGTTEGRMLADFCRNQPVSLTVCVATEYGETMVAEAENIEVLAGRRDEVQIGELLQSKNAKLVIDATHPYATEVTKNLKSACAKCGTEYLRLLREKTETVSESCIFVKDTSEAVEYLSKTEGNVLLTVGSKELEHYTKIPDFKNRLYARILPMTDGVIQAQKLGFAGKHLICMQGPFSEEMNIALMHSLNVAVLVTKDTGSTGGFPEKISAVQACGAKAVIIARPNDEKGMGFTECKSYLMKKFGFHSSKQITIIGIGPGSAGEMTQDAQDACRNAELIIGAKRITESLSAFGKPTVCAILPDEIVNCIKNSSCTKIVAAMSGDTGFFSGTKKLISLLAEYDVTVLPGICSLVYFAARLGISWDDACFASTHGRSCNFLAKIKKNKKMFFLTGGKTGVQDMISSLVENGLQDVFLTVGENLSYPDERITKGTAAELSSRYFAPLAVVLAENRNADYFTYVSGLPDSAFLRAKVPMTKQEVRAVTLAKLELCKNSVCYDIGAGTGSVSLEMANWCEDGMVYAIEQKTEACTLIEQNKIHLGISNVTVISGKAPEALQNLPVPTHAFIGGSSGNLESIIQCLLKKNPEIRIVLNTVTAESFAQAVECCNQLPLKDIEMIQLSASRGEKLGRYHLMTAQNPVYIIAFRGGSAHV